MENPNPNPNPNPNQNLNQNPKENSNPKILSDKQILAGLRVFVADERKQVGMILDYLREVDRRRLYADSGYPSLWEFCIRELGYSEGAASRRISSMRLIREIPELKTEVEMGKHNLSSLAQAHKFFRVEEKHHHQSMPVEKKLEVLRKLEGKTSLECEKELLAMSSVPMQISRPERERPLDADNVELKIIVTQPLLFKLKRVQALRSHASPNMNYAELLDFMADQVLKRLDLGSNFKTDKELIECEQKNQNRLLKIQQKISTSETAKGNLCEPQSLSSHLRFPQELQKHSPMDSVPKTATPTPPTVSDTAIDLTLNESAKPATISQTNVDSPPISAVNSGERQEIPMALKRAVWRRDKSRCSYFDPNTGRKCDSLRFLEIDHIQPVALGGKNEFFNLRLRCRSHNQRSAIQAFGLKRFESGLRSGKGD